MGLRPDVGDLFCPGPLRMRFSRRRFRRLLLIFTLHREIPFLRSMLIWRTPCMRCKRALNRSKLSLFVWQRCSWQRGPMPFVMEQCDFLCPLFYLQEVRGLVWRRGGRMVDCSVAWRLPWYGLCRR